MNRIPAAIALAVSLSACGTAVTPQLVQCKLEALKVLPRDPMMVTPYDAVDVVNRLNACEAPPAAADAGRP